MKKWGTMKQVFTKLAVSVNNKVKIVLAFLFILCAIAYENLVYNQFCILPYIFLLGEGNRTISKKPVRKLRKKQFQL